MKTEGSL